MEQLEQGGVKIAEVVLHIGLDTFAPVTEEDAETHRIHTEWCELGAETADMLNAAHREGRRIVAVGTTSVRVLESAARNAEAGDVVGTWEGPTDLFILPGYSFQVVDAMITNFHLPRSTLLMLVSAFASREHILSAYKAAIEAEYRFYSFGDAMLIY
jgi:S-adenosylmethionine:tRNA ribosyltransferase-isomerase